MPVPKKSLQGCSSFTISPFNRGRDVLSDQEEANDPLLGTGSRDKKNVEGQKESNISPIV